MLRLSEAVGKTHSVFIYFYQCLQNMQQINWLSKKSLPLHVPRNNPSVCCFPIPSPTLHWAVHVLKRFPFNSSVLVHVLCPIPYFYLGIHWWLIKSPFHIMEINFCLNYCKRFSQHSLLFSFLNFNSFFHTLHPNQFSLPPLLPVSSYTSPSPPSTPPSFPFNKRE